MSMKAQHVLISLLSTGICNASQKAWDAEQIDWVALEEAALKNRVLPLLSHALETLEIDPPVEMQNRIVAMRKQCFGEAMAHIAAAVRLCRNFHTHGIDVVCVKGVARAYEVYGKWDVRFTHDVDLLVRDRDYRGAAKVLTSSGYDAPISEADDWWHDYLGESPYLPVRATGPTVDLHQKLHQPGTPALTNPGPLHEHHVMRSLGNFSLPMLDKRDAMMLTANSFGKAIRSRQPWLLYAHEIAYARANDPELTDRMLDDYAAQSGMSRLWHHAKTASDLVFGGAKSGQIELPPHIDLDKPGLIPEPVFLYRSRLLWLWSEGSLLRPLRFVKEFLWVTLADIKHDLFAFRQRNQQSFKNIAHPRG
ncbi:MAG: nucleotidyltransferase family protein [Pseudomonadota bacterium]